MMKNKYVQIQHLDYFNGLYELRGFKINDLTGEEFSFYIGEIESREEATIRCKEEVDTEGKSYFLDSFLSYSSLGWSEFKLGDFSGGVSGVSNFPLDIADGLIKALNDNLPVAIGLDEEGSEFTLILDYYDRVSIIEYEEDGKLYKCNVTHKQLANMFLNDMERDFSKYIEDEYYFDFNQMGKEKYSKLLLEKLNLLEKLI